MRSRFNPNRYDATRWDARQSDIPSQQMDVGIAYRGDVVPDVESRLAAEDLAADALASGADTSAAGGPDAGAGGPGSGCDIRPQVRAIWESRPAQSQDAFGPIVTSLTISNQTFTVPNGFIFILKQIGFANDDGGLAVDEFGIPTQVCQLNVTINGNPVPGYTGVDVSNGGVCGFEIDSFILAQSADVIKVALSRGALVLGFPTRGGVNMYGTLLLDDGRDISNQVGDPSGAAISMCGADLAALKPNPLILPTSQGPLVIPNGNVVVPKNCPLPPAISVNDYLACLGY